MSDRYLSKKDHFFSNKNSNACALFTHFVSHCEFTENHNSVDQPAVITCFMYFSCAYPNDAVRTKLNITNTFVVVVLPPINFYFAI